MSSRRRFTPTISAGFLLAGGGNSRMGQDKALLAWKGSTLIGSVAREVFNAVGNVSLIESPERYGNLGFPCAVYNRRLLHVVESAIHSKLFKMHDFVSTIRAHLWPAPDPAVFRNINTRVQLTHESPSGAR